MNLIDKAITYINPGAGLRRIRARHMAAMMDSAHTGASRTKRSLRGWGLRASGDPDSEVLPELDTLRTRSRDLAKNNPIAKGALNTVVTNVIGSGLRLQVRLDREFLKMDDSKADAWESDVERRFRLWAETHDADAGRRLNFYEIQELAFSSFLQSGEVLALLPLIKRPGTVSDLRVQLIEADRLSNPEFTMDTDMMMSGIEVGRYGEPVAYHLNVAPASKMVLKPEWKRVTAFGSSGRQNVIHVYRQDRPGQRRGVPYLTPVIESLKQLGRYSEAELQAAVVAAMFAVFVKSPSGTPDILGAALPDAEKRESEPQHYELAPGAIIGLAEGEEIQTANPGRPNAGFDTFVQALLRQVGMALELPYELLIRHFQSSYSASRAALLEAWKFFRARRAWIAGKLCQPIYEEWLMGEVLAGRILAPGFLDGEEIRRAYCGAEWIGPAPGQIDPTKETQAAAQRLALGISTLAEETAQISGGEWERKIRQLAKERRMMKDLGFVQATKPSSATVSDVMFTDGEELDDDDDLAPPQKP